MSIKDVLEDKVSRKKLKEVPTAFDIIGNKEKAIAIIEVPGTLKKEKKLIAKAIMQKHKNVKSVLEKKSPRKGVFRIRSYRIISGDKNTGVLHKESGCIFRLDPRKVYFSQREGTERLRIAELVGNDEKIVVFFAGIGAFPIIIGKKKRVNIVGIEINPEAIRYFKENVRLNKVRVNILKGDVKEIIDKNEEYEKKFNRVIMPLPEQAIEFLEQALFCLKKEGICHLYCFSKEDEIKEMIERIKMCVEKHKRKFVMLGKQKVLPWGPRTYKYRIDFKVD